MGKLTEGRLPSLFGGVSRQPDAVRRPEQVETADNVLLSVTTGGFEKRPATWSITPPPTYSSSTPLRAHRSLSMLRTVSGSSPLRTVH